MSKSLSQIFLPALGGAALTLSVAFVLANQNYGEEKIASLETRISQVEAQKATARDKADAERARAAELELKITQLQTAVDERGAIEANLTAPAPSFDGIYGIGRTALTEEVAAWDVDVLPDGRGLPEGSGNAYDGEEVFAQKCASCHGDFAEGVDNWPVLAGGFNTLAEKDPVKTVGSYWPYLSTAYDYIYRSMPFGAAGTLTADETYAIVAYILYSNDLVDDEFELSHENLGDFDMHNKDGFVIDDRPEKEYSEWRTEPCMENCKDKVDISMRSVFLVETPPEGGSNSVMNPASVEDLPSFTADGPSFIPVASTKPKDDETAEPDLEATEDNHDNAALIAAGEKVFKKCAACHQVGDNAKNRSGPQLNDLIGRTMGSVEGFKYSKALMAAMEDGRVWDEASLAAFLAKPRSYMKGTKMAFSGLKKESDLTAIIEYLKASKE
ncbi:MAG: c-type cytochrome [Rhodobacteraceae bacterium]|nr:c-type cytochrome [Paracoccaceae bacterium]